MSTFMRTSSIHCGLLLSMMQSQGCQINSKTCITNVVIRINANQIYFQIKWILTIFRSSQFIFMQVSPTPKFGVDNVRKTFSTSNLIENYQISAQLSYWEIGSRKVQFKSDTYFKQNINFYFSFLKISSLQTYLQSTIQCSRNCNTSRNMGSVSRNCRNKMVQFLRFFFKFLHQTLNGSFTKLFRFATLSPAHQCMDNTHASISGRRCIFRFFHDDLLLRDVTIINYVFYFVITLAKENTTPPHWRHALLLILSKDDWPIWHLILSATYYPPCSSIGKWAKFDLDGVSCEHWTPLFKITFCYDD